MNVWQFFQQIGVFSIAVAAITFLLRASINAWLKARVSQHEIELKSAAERALEQVRHDLRVAEARKSRLLSRQANVIAGTYARLERLHESLSALAGPINHTDAKVVLELQKTAIQLFNDFASFYHERGIWLDRATCDQLNELVTLLGTLLNKLNYNISGGEIVDRKRWMEIYKRLESDVPAARTSLDVQFRELLGVSVEVTSGPVQANTDPALVAATAPIGLSDAG